MKRIIWSGILATCFASVACSSIKTTHLKRNKSNTGWKKTCLHGMPVTLRVPHHYEVNVAEVYYEMGGNLLRDASDTNATKSPVTSLDVDFKVVEAEEVFTVDFVRPGAGTLQTKATLDSNTHYFKSIDNEIVDNTIEEITKSIQAIGDAIKPFAAKKSLAEIPGVTQHRKILATLLVDVNDPFAKEKIHEFLCKHLNSCTDCATRPGSKVPLGNSQPGLQIQSQELGQPLPGDGRK